MGCQPGGGRGDGEVRRALASALSDCPADRLSRLPRRSGIYSVGACRARRQAVTALLRPSLNHPLNGIRISGCDPLRLSVGVPEPSVTMALQQTK